MDPVIDPRVKTTLVCGALALAIAVSSLLRTKVRRVHVLYAALAADIGFWYLSQSLFGYFQAPIWDRLRVLLAVLLPALAANLFEAMVPDEGDGRGSRVGKASLLIAVPMALLGLSPQIEHTVVRVFIFLYVVAVVAAGLFELGQRGRASRSRATQRRVRFLVVTGALAGVASVADFAWVIGYKPEYYPPPVGVVLSVVFLFMLAQALRHERLLDLYEMLGRLVVAIAVAFLIAGVFYLMIEVVGKFNTVWLNALMVAIVVLVLFNPLRDWVEKQIQRLIERGKLEPAVLKARRRLAHTLEIDAMAQVVMAALEESRSVTTAGLYLLLEDQSGFECFGAMGNKAPQRIEVATAHALLEHLEHATVVLEQVGRDISEGHEPRPGGPTPEAVLAAAEVLGSLHETAVVVAIRADEGELVGLLVVDDERIGDAFSPEDIVLLEGLGTQIGVVVENSRVYEKMNERDRLAVLGQMAAGLAHEIRNPLGAIKGAAQLLAEPAPSAPDPDNTSQEFLGIILEEVDRLNAVVGSVLDLARQNPDAPPPIDVNAVVRRTLQVMSAEWPEKGLEVETSLFDELPLTAIAPDQLRQVLMNLLRNATQALRGRGKIRVDTYTRKRASAASVVLRVSDDGPGISAKGLRSIFLPFYTTKDDGTGLGLAICQRIVQEAGGRIDVRSRVGEGTTFEVVLPAQMEPLGTPVPAVTDVVGGVPADTAAASSTPLVVAVER